MRIQILTNSRAPIFRQITDQIRRAIASGELSVGDLLPSVRQLAHELVINPNTVAKAYGELVRDAVLDSVAGKGFFVAKPRSVFSKAERLRRIDEAIDRLLNEMLTLNISGEELIARLKNRLEKIRHDQ